MTVLPVIILLGITVMIGLVMGMRVLGGHRNKPVMIGAHVLLGAAAFEPLAVILHGAQNATSSARAYGTATLLVIGLALISGVVRSLVIKQSPAMSRPLLAVHATIAAIALVLAFLLAAKLS
jgi:hypothetical protein